MMSRTLHRSGSWTRVLAGLGLFMIVTASIADEARKPAKGPGASRPPTAAVTQPATDVRPALNVICVNSVQCFSTKTPATASTARPALDLRAPDLRSVFSEAELHQTLQLPEEEQHDIQETVQVEGQRQFSPVSIGLLSIPWAIMHPSQAWRILTPMTDAK